uniref:CTCK domain-containing protein n=1 Tax=Mola mola TaxID=94237 RepID=A0A3Q3WMJ8_MOLML
VWLLKTLTLSTALTLCVLQVNIVSCDGKCPSASIYNYNINTYARFCKCCRETGLQRRSVQLYCSGNATWVRYSIQEPTDCGRPPQTGRRAILEHSQLMCPTQKADV